MTLRLYLTDHALERFKERWRPQLSNENALAELTLLVQRAGATRKRTLVGDAQLYMATSDTGERIALAVRDGAVISVLPANGEGAALVDGSVPVELLEESEATKAACEAILAKDAVANAALEERRAAMRKKSDRRFNAIALLTGVRSGRLMPNADSIARAYAVLGIGPDDPLPPSAAELRCASTPERRRSAEQVISDWKAGRAFSKKALRNAHLVLGLPFEERS